MEKMVLKKSKIVFWGGRILAATYRDMLPENAELVAIFDNDKTLAPIFPDVPLYYGKDGFYAWKEENISPGEEIYFQVAIGSRKGETRVEISEFLESEGLTPCNLIHPSAQIAPSVKLGKGVVVMAGAVLDSAVEIGDYSIIAIQAVVSHGGKLGNGVMLCGANILAGCCDIGDYVTLYVGTHLAAHVKVGTNAVVGIGSVVVSDVKPGTVVFGCPARIIGPLPGQEI